MTTDNDDQQVFQYQVNICGKNSQVVAPDCIEAATLAIEEYKANQENFDIGTIIQIVNLDTKESQYILSEVALANAGFYKEAAQLQKIMENKSKKKKK